MRIENKKLNTPDGNVAVRIAKLNYKLIAWLVQKLLNNRVPLNSNNHRANSFSMSKNDLRTRDATSTPTGPLLQAIIIKVRFVSQTSRLKA